MDMLSESIVARFRDAVASTFEMLAFSEVNEWDVLENPPDAGDLIGSSIGIRQPVKGIIGLFLSLNHCRGMVGAVHGIDVDPAEGKAPVLIDFMNELANTVAGRLAAFLAEDGGKIRLELPETVDDPVRSFAELPAEGVLMMRFLVDMEPGYCYIFDR